MNSKQRRTARRTINATPAPIYIMDSAGTTAIKSTIGNTSLSGWTPPNTGSFRELRNTENDYALAKMTCVWAARAIDVASEKISEVLRRGKVKTKATGDELPNHAFTQALALTFQKYQQDVFKRWVSNKFTFGEAYIEKVRTYPFGERSIGYPSCLRAINPLSIEPETYTGEITGYRYSDSRHGYIPLKLDAVLFDKFDNDLDDLRGYSKIGAALQSVNVDVAVVVLAKNHLKNNARPGIIFTPRGDQKMSEPEEKEFKRTISEQVKGISNTGRPLYLTFPMEIITAAPPTFEDQQFLSDNQMERICSAIGTPVGLVNYNNAKFQLSAEQTKNFYLLTVLPNADTIARLVSTQLLPFFDPSGTAIFEIDQDAELDRLDDPKAKSERINGQLAAGYITLNQARVKTGDKPLPDGDVLFFPSGVIPIKIADLQRIEQVITAASGGGQFPAPTGAPAVATPTLPTPSAMAALPEKAATKSGAVMLGLGAQPDLVGLQNQCRQYCASQNIQVEWNDPQSFHITLLYSPSLSDDQLAALRTYVAGLDIDPLSLRIGSLGTFDSLDSYAIRFMLRRNSDLLDLQQECYDYCQANDIPVSQYSQPDQFKPHITMGYASVKPRGLTFNSKLTVTPIKVQLGVDDAIAYERPLVIQDSAKAVTVEPTPAPVDTPEPVDTPLDELAKWQTKVKQKGAAKAAGFICNAITRPVAAYIKAVLSEPETDTVALFEDTRAMLAIPIVVKSFEDNRAGFLGSVYSVITAAANDEIKQRSFGSQMRTQLRRWGLQAFFDGLADGGEKVESLSPDQLKLFRSWENEQSGLVSNFGKEVFAVGLTELETKTRAQMWANVSLSAVYYAGLEAAAADKDYTWEYGDTDHCDTCKSNHGQTKKLSEWKKLGLPQSDKLICKGFHCQCRLKLAK